MPTFKKKCPVPFNQQPLNEYLELKKRLLFSWSTSNIKYYIHTISKVFLFSFIFLGFIFIIIFFKLINIYKILLLDFIAIDIIFSLTFFRLYLGWSYIIKRLLSATIFYEESGWYDGQLWIKTANNLTRDRLVGLYQVLPFINRLKYTCIIFCINFILHYYLYYIL
uniref:Putative chloroplast RF36 n=1 Tax=Cumathamnion serrulatum TaxID=1206573 RepID=A0A7U1G3U9_9FLOR|nr:putative chloroplast RF36 [Cumathamnion serrulatum]QQY85341.1 putative chloroplast RF36 [Cumathamnion serrulatum]